MAQLTNTVMMVRPTAFNYNPQTAADNKFQHRAEGLTADQVRQKAMGEFEGLVAKLRANNIHVHEEEDTVKQSADAVFPNNWISFHQEGRIVVYPMRCQNRRLERRKDIIAFWKEKLRAEVLDYSPYEKQEKYLEGTGSMVLDRVNRIAYACTSLRTDAEVLNQFCQDLKYTQVIFKASHMVDGQLSPIYHTNVMMSIGDTFSIVCLESMQDKEDRKAVSDSLSNTGKDIIPISLGQMNEFAGNVLQLCSSDGKRLLVMSTRAFNSFTPEQLTIIRKHCDDIVHSPLDVIETLGGGGARCMLAEVFRP